MNKCAPPVTNSPGTSHSAPQLSRRHRAARARACALGRAGRGIAADARARARPRMDLRASGTRTRRASARTIFFSDRPARERCPDAAPHRPSGILGTGFRSHARRSDSAARNRARDRSCARAPWSRVRSRLPAPQRRISHCGCRHRLRLHRHRAGARIARRADHRDRHFRRRARSRAPQRRAPRRHLANRFHRVQSAWTRSSTQSPGHQLTRPRSFDLIASNPPYIGRQEAATLPREVREHEPAIALFGGETGTELYAPLIAQAAMLLKPGGILVLELGHDSAEHVSQLARRTRMDQCGHYDDLAGISRVASAQRASSNFSYAVGFACALFATDGSVLT